MPPETSPDPSPGPIDTQVTRRVPNLEEINWKKRALDAEAALDGAKKELAAVTERCATHERNIESIAKASADAEAAAAHERAIVDALAPHHPIDAALCATLIERELDREAPESGVNDGEIASRLGPIVTTLVADRPYLFRAPMRTSSHTLAGATMAGAPSGSGRDPLDSALDEARSSGSRSHLLRYLRLRRGA